MASFEQNQKNKMWSVRFRIVENGLTINKRLSGFRTKKEAESAHTKFLTEFTPSSFKIKNTEDLTFTTILNKYLSIDIRSTKDSTHKDKKSIFSLYIAPYFKLYQINNLDKRKLHEWQTCIWTLKKENGEYLSYGYLKKIKKIFNHFLNWVEEVYSIPNQLRSIRTPKNTEQKKEMLFWEVEEFSSFIKEVDDILWKTFFMFQFYNGCRLGETLSLTPSDYKNGEITINKSLSFKTTDGNRYKITATKNYKNRKNKLLNILDNQMQEYNLWRKENNISASFLFGGDKPIAPTTIRHKFDYYLNKANEKLETPLTRIRIHDLRHSYVSMLASMNINSKIVADLVGDTEETIISTYKHLYKNDKNEAINQANLLLEKKFCS